MFGALKSKKYETKTVRSTRQVRKHVEQGWEIVSSTGREDWVWGRNMKVTMRREAVNPLDTLLELFGKNK